MNKYLLILFGILFAYKAHSQGADCSSATVLPNVQNYCSGAGAYTNTGSTASSQANATCFSANATEDVWFQFVAVGTDALVSAAGSGAGGTMTRPRIAIYSGSCPGGLTQIGCTNGTAGQNVTQLYQSTLTLGTTYFIRVSTNNAGEGTFELCVNNYTPSANPGADCGSAAFLCNNNSLSVGLLSGGGLNPDEPEPNTCIYDPNNPTEGNSSWFYWTCDVAGTLTFDITPVNPGDDIDFLLYRLTTTNVCGTRTSLRCNAASCLNANGSTGTNFTDTDIDEPSGCTGSNAYCQFINMTAGTTYALLINNWSGNTGYTLSFGGTGTFLGPKPIITTNTSTICAGNSVNFDGSTSTNVGGGLAWNFANGGSPTAAAGTGPHTVTYNTAGSYVAILNGTSALGCTTTTTTTITVNTIPAAPIAADVTKCLNAPVTSLTATGTNLLWYTSAIGGVGSVTAPSPATSVVGITSYYVSQTVSACESPREQVDFTVIAVPDVTVNDVTICPGLTATLTASSTSSPVFSWLPATNINTTGGSTVVVTPPGSTTLTYTVTATENGCTAQAISTVSITTTTSINVSSVSICNGANATLNATGSTAYTWSPATGLSATTGASVTANPTITTVYTILETSSGCNGTTTCTVTVNSNPTIDAGNNSTICNGATATLAATGGLTYLWTADPTLSNLAVNNPIASPTTTTTYFVTGTDVNGCVGSDNVTVAVVPTFSLSAIQDSVTCFGSSDGSIILTVNPAVSTFPPYTFLWSNGALTQNIASVSAGTYQVTVSNSATCSQTLFVAVLQPAAPVSLLSVTNNPVTCNGGNNGSISVSASGGTPGYVFSLNGGAFSPVSTFTGLSAGAHGVIAKDVNACVSANLALTVAQPAVVHFNSPTAAAAMCIGQSVTLTGAATGGNGGYNYTWTDGVNPTVASTTPIIVSPVTGPVNYTVTAVDALNCSSDNQQVVTVTLNGPLIMNSVTPSPGKICETKNITVNVSGSGGDHNLNYTWAPSSGVSFLSADGSSVKLSPTLSTLYTISVNDGCGTSPVSTTYSLTVNPLPALTITPASTSGCTPLFVQFTGASNPASTLCAWNFDGNGTSTSCNTSATFIKDGGYHVTYSVVDINGCTNTAIASVSVFPLPQAMFLASPQPTSIIDPLITFTDVSFGNIASHTWLFNDSIATSSILEVASYTYGAVGTYPVTLAVVSDKGCVDTTTQNVYIDEEYVVYVPNAFTPDGDGVNDEFFATGTGIISLEMTIYDRWGGIIFNTPEMNKGWSGKDSKDKRVEKGVYIYKLVVTNFLGEIKLISGHVTLVR